MLSRWGRGRASPQLANQLTAIVCSLRGSVCIYQGEELGLPEAEVPYDALQDPYGIAFWPNFKGRDGCRTPMPWRDDEHAGFSRVRPWLPVPPSHRALSVEHQERDPNSALHGFRTFMQWRRTQPALCWGDIRFLETDEPILAFTRSFRGTTVLAAFNLEGRPIDMPLPLLSPMRCCEGHGLAAGVIGGGRLHLPPHGTLFAEVETVPAPLAGSALAKP